MKLSRLGSSFRKMRRMTDGRKLVMRPLMTGRFARVLRPGVLCNLLTCVSMSEPLDLCQLGVQIRLTHMHC